MLIHHHAVAPMRGLHAQLEDEGSQGAFVLVLFSVFHGQGRNRTADTQIFSLLL
jgi:hypothetical protein